jgi:membrane protein involved in colicin uptake
LTKDVNIVKSTLEKYINIADTLRKQLQGNSLDVTTTQYTTNSQKNQDRALVNKQLWNADKLVERLKTILNDLEAAQAKAKADAEAKAKADAEAAEAKLKAAEEAAKQAKIAALKKQIAESTDPNVKKQLTDELSGLLQEGAAGLKSNKFLLIGGAVAVIGILFYFFRSKE